MSFDISSVQRTQATAAAARAYSALAPNQARRTDEAVTVDVSNSIPASPPAEVLDAMGTAAQAADRLATQDRALSFSVDAATGKVTVAVHDTNGNVLFTVPGSKALDIAGGGSL
jgi:hypothetical protein